MGFATSIPFHRWLLRHPRFQEGRLSTHFLDEEFEGLPSSEGETLDVLALGAALTHLEETQPSPPGANGSTTSGWLKASRLATVASAGTGFAR